MDTLGKMVLSGSVWAWDPLGIFLYILTSLLDQVLVYLLAPGFIAIALYNQQGPYFRQIKLDFTLWKHSVSIEASFFSAHTHPHGRNICFFCTWQKWAFQIKGNYNKSIFYYFQSIQVFIHPSADSGTTRKCLEFCECYTSLTCMHAEAKTKEKKVFSFAG